MKKSFDLPSYLKSQKEIVDAALEKALRPAAEWPEKLHQSARYSIFAGGKRLRPILCLAANETVGGKMEAALPIACALEMIHTYSLIHDDLPAMDDDDLRRGNPTNHKVFGEAIAILAGDSLLTDAFGLIAKVPSNGNAAALLGIISRITQAIGSRGMVGGQVQDLLSEKKQISREELENLHRHKTGKLIQVSIEAGAIMGDATDAQLAALSRYGECIGLSFQIADDILDIEGGQEIGKDIGSDVEKQKATYPSVVGLTESKQLAAELTEKALAALEGLGPTADPLREIARYVVYRKN
jgi:geranylgeranyl diphosphate synthase type II